MIPYGQKIVSDHLRTHASIQVLGSRVVSKTPQTLTDPWIRVTQINARDTPGSGELDALVAYDFQLDCYAGGEGGLPEADTLSRTARAALKELQGTVVESEGRDVPVSQVVFTGMIRLPDSDFEPARERVVLDATVRMKNVSP